jgi:hypothetical protein
MSTVISEKYFAIIFRVEAYAKQEISMKAGSSQTELFITTAVSSSNPTKCEWI